MEKEGGRLLISIDAAEPANDADAYSGSKKSVVFRSILVGSDSDPESIEPERAEIDVLVLDEPVSRL